MSLRNDKISQIEQFLSAYQDFTKNQNIKLSSRDNLQNLKRQKLQCINNLRRCCITKYGLVSKELRARVWPVILNIDISKLPKKPNRPEIREIQAKDLNQVQLDVNRCVSRFPENLPTDQQVVLQENLTDLILWVLSRNPTLNYYQGYHDIAITILQVTGMRLALPVVEKLTQEYWSGFWDDFLIFCVK